MDWKPSPPNMSKAGFRGKDSPESIIVPLSCVPPTIRPFMSASIPKNWAVLYPVLMSLYRDISASVDRAIPPSEQTNIIGSTPVVSKVIQCLSECIPNGLTGELKVLPTIFGPVSNVHSANFTPPIKTRSLFFGCTAIHMSYTP